MNDIGIRDLGDIGIAGIDVYGTDTKKTSKDTPKLLMFFRSEDQAKGLPKEDSKSSKIEYTIGGIKTKKYPIKDDTKYNQSFGFDLFRENLMGNNEIVYKVDEDTNGDYIVDTNQKHKESATKNLQSFFDSSSKLTLELIDTKKTFYIDEEFILKKGTSPLKDKSYYAPNILIKPGKQVIISAKFFDTDSSSKLNQTVTFKLSNSKGIESVTQVLTFNQNEEIIGFNIKTKANETIDTQATITAFIKDSSNKDLEIGRLTILPNKVYEPKLIFVDVFYKKNTLTTSSNYSNLANDLNNKSFNQASINFNLAKNQILNIIDTDFSLKDPTNTLGKWLVQKTGTTDYETAKTDDVLTILKAKFFENIAILLLNEIEKSMQDFEVNDGVITRKLLPKDKTLKDWFFQCSQLPGNSKATKWYDTLVVNLHDYISSIKLGFYPLFMCNNIYSSTSVLAQGLVWSKGLIVPKAGIGNTMIIAHELGHNLGLRHTFDVPNPSTEKGDIKIGMIDTLENIMDYLPDVPGTHSKNFITYQLQKMRENSEKLKYNIDDMGYKIEKEKSGASFPTNVIKDFSNNKKIETFSNNICLYLFKSYEDIYNLQNTTKLESYRDKILSIFVDIIKNYFKNL
ncbi:hypothetical protein J2X97_003129 [Epilithonimonas hungarica]|uniref:hypothetical protein n=1 Tax=Epilithonimonas hungarica TaxID=454006 RepID=UPI002780E6B2|nr:hypothetical protein [Epilithonimonas hungarica]MDP9957460.1 hypothetical protein [Epilithonimonas hungarica]